MIEDLLKPKSIRLEACTLCQLKCKCCYMRNLHPTVGSGYLKFEDFVNFVEKNDFVKQIELSNSGEIFLNPDLLKIMEYAHKKDIELTAYNGVNLNNVKEEVLEGLVKYKFKKLTCSIDGTSNQTYSQYRVGGNFDTVIANIKKINNYKKIYNSEFPKMKYQFIIFGMNEHEIPEAKKLAKKLDMEINFKLSWDNFSFSPIKNHDFVFEQTGLREKLPEEYLKKEDHNFLRNMCIKMWTQPQINWDGRLLGCCIISENDFNVNVFELGLETALQSSLFAYTKNMLMNKVKKDPQSPCAECFHYIGMQKADSYITEEEIIKYLEQKNSTRDIS